MPPSPLPLPLTVIASTTPCLAGPPTVPDQRLCWPTQYPRPIRPPTLNFTTFFCIGNSHGPDRSFPKCDRAQPKRLPNYDRATQRHR
ncbi:hypothetical protein B0J17DRAFT_640941 [Rhizoctonia solani]|nr:hypothetical protein B0J17DRAFT_640941 [Rhizoctonia solani]